VSAVAAPAATIAVRRVSLDAPREERERLFELLSADERERAARFHFARDRDRFAVGRGALRALLAAELGTDPRELRFDYGPQGKPALAGDELQFNVSHSGGIALVAIAHRGELGIDVELDSQDLANEQIPERFFSPAEVTALRSLPARLQPRAFLTCWTRKEAFIKAKGDGLSLPLDSFDVTLEPGVPAALLRTAWSEEEPSQWRLVDLSGRGTVAALAVRGHHGAVVVSDWRGEHDPPSIREST
jgi:4'-phosphopantetheinyl transferase